MTADCIARAGQCAAKASQEDVKLFNAVNVSTDTIMELASSVAALRHGQAIFTASIGSLKDAARMWHEEEPKAIKLRSDLLKAFDYALRNVPNARRALKAIRDGTGNPDMLKDLSALCALGRRYTKELKAINYDLALLAAAETKTAELNRLYIDAFVEKKTVDSRIIRDRAFTYMRQMMGEILDAAEFVLKDNPERLDLYHSAYRSRQTGDSTGPDAEDADTDAPAAPAAPAA